MKRELEALGAVVRHGSDAAADPTTLQRARRRLFARASAPRPTRWRAVALASAAVLAVVLWWAAPWQAPPISFEVGEPPASGQVGAWMAATGEALPLRFSEGSSVEVDPGARLRVMDTSARGATLLLEKGSLRARVTPHRVGAWTFRAGPFSVEVKGTSFDVSWDPATETFALRLTEGRVVVTGPVLAEPRQLESGDHLEIAVGDRNVSLRHVPTEEPARPADEEAPAARDAGAEAAAVEPDAVAPAEARAPSPSAAPPAAPDWRRHLAAGEHRAAMAAIDDAEFGALLQRGAAGEVMALADAARLGGQPARARAALLTYRKRFGGGSQTAFLLGKIAADQLRAPGEAVQWFETYLRESPGGPLAEQALGRILELSQGGDPAQVRALAERYLARYPDGAYAGLARRLAP